MAEHLDWGPAGQDGKLDPWSVGGPQAFASPATATPPTHQGPHDAPKREGPRQAAGRATLVHNTRAARCARVLRRRREAPRTKGGVASPELKKDAKSRRWTHLQG